MPAITVSTARRKPRRTLTKRITTVRRRVKSGTGKSSISTKPNSLAGIEKSLARTTISRPIRTLDSNVANFIRCRLNPFSMAMPSTGIPDGNGGRKLVVDHWAYSNITVGASGALQIRTIPSLPFNVLMKPNTSGSVTGFAVDGISVQNPVTTTAFPISSWIPICPIPEWAAYSATAPADLLELQPPYSAVRGRIVTHAVRITYIGTPLTAQGGWQINTEKVSAQDSVNHNSKALTTNVWDTPSATGVYSPLTVYHRLVDLGGTAQIYSPDTRFFRCEVPLQGFVRHDGEFEWKNFSMTGAVATDSSTAQTLIASKNGVQSPGHAFYDSAWDSLIITGSGLPSGAQFRVESIMCMEYEPQSGSNVASFAKITPSNIATREAVTELNNVSRNVPVASPSSSAQSNTEKLINRVGQGIRQGFNTAMKLVPGRNIGRNAMNLATGKGPFIPSYQDTAGVWRNQQGYAPPLD
jgi:hypothetical protein